MLQVTVRDRFALGMRRQPPLATADQLLNLVVADEIMLVVVEYRDEHLKMRQQVAQAAFATKRHREVAAGPPLWTRFVQELGPCPYRKPERLRKCAPTQC